MLQFIPINFDPFAEGNEIEKLTFTNEPQREIWLSCVIGSDDANRSYNESLSLQITGSLNVGAFKQAVADLVLRHEALRATVSPNGENLIIYKNFPVALELTDLTHLDEAERTKTFKCFLKDEAETVLNIKDGPLFKTFLHKTGEQEFYFTILIHHIIGDGWSTGIILEDLSKLYNAYVKGEKDSLSPPSQISDYVEAQENFKLTKEYKKTEDFWLNLYKEDVPLLDLPTDNPRRSPRSYKGNRMDQPLSKERVEQLKALGAKAGCSLVTTLLAAFEVLLYQQTHQRDLVVGVPSSGQAASGLDDVVGHCVNLLPIRTHIKPSETFLDYLTKRKKEVLDAYDHQRITFGELIKKLYIPRDPSRVALVPVMFNVDMGMDSEVSFEGLQHKLISNPRAYENFEIYLNVTGSKENMTLEWSYNTDLFHEETIKAFYKKYDTLLSRVSAHADTTIARLVFEEGTSVSVSRGTDVDIPLKLTLTGLITESVTKYPDKTAVSYNDISLTYRQLSEKTEQLSSYLINKGISVGDIVAISLDRSMEMLVCLLAVMRAGAVYLPLDPGYPQERISFMLHDSGAKLLLTSKKFQGNYKSQANELVIEDIWQQLTNAPKQKAPASINGNSLAYLLYTSGSTGTPKGVKITHRNLVNFLTGMKAVPGMNDTDKLLAVTSISFDIAGLELYLPLIVGAELVIASTDATKDGRLMLDLIAQKNISIMQATPSTWQMLLDSGWEKQYPIKILSGGEALPLELASKLLELCSELWNMYGPTETTIWSTVKQILHGENQISIGKPINNTQVYIMDEDGHPLAPKQMGEIYIGGEGVADGYYNRAELTAEKFVSDPFSKNRSSKLYRTGDLGKLLSNGEIQCLGRIDHQVKIRGHRIEPGEIEANMERLDGIKQCVVIVREDVPGDKRLTGYVTLKEEQKNTNHQSWKDRWDTIYKIGTDEKQDLDSALLENLNNGEELGKQHKEWLHLSINRIKEIGAKKIYEIGSGAGQLLFELAPETDFYLATDYAQTAIENIHARLCTEPRKWDHVKAETAPADDFSALGNVPVDLILINSVAQYFPNSEYLIRVIRQAAETLKEGGCIFIGDMQGKNTLHMYHAMDYLPKASELTTVEAFKEIVTNRVRIEEELAADPAFFYLLPSLIPGITGVDVQLRKGQLLNETTKYHYDIWLYVGKPVEIAETQLVLDWSEANSLSQLEQILSSGNSNVIEVKNILNARTAKDYTLQQLLANMSSANVITEIKNEVDQVTTGMLPDLFWELGAKLTYRTHVRWTTDGTDGLFDAVFIKPEQKIVLPPSPVPVQGKNIHGFIRIPVSKNEVHLERELVKSWKEKLQDVLPAYMIPDNFVALKNMPLTPNAKIDRKALPKPQTKKDSSKSIDRPLTIDEQLIADIWAEVLEIESVNASDDFFQLGGHSLLAVKVMVALEKKTGKRLTIATLFEHSTIEKLAKQLRTEYNAKEWDVLVPIKTTGKKIPLFFVHGADLNVLLFKPIADYMAPDQPVYGLQALGINHETHIPATIEDMVKRYVADMVKAYPNGPYAIAGYSLGGFIGFEIARQLKLMGKEVAFLGIIDTFAGNYFEGSTSKRVRHEWNKIAFLVRSLIRHPKESLAYQLSVVKQKWIERFHKDGYIPEGMFTSYEAEIYKKYGLALDGYKLSEADIRITLFAVEKRLYYVEDLQTLGWNRFAKKGVITHSVPGDHTTVLYPPNNKALAIKIQEVLDRKLHQENYL